MNLKFEDYRLRPKRGSVKVMYSIFKIRKTNLFYTWQDADGPPTENAIVSRLSKVWGVKPIDVTIHTIADK